METKSQTQQQPQDVVTPAKEESKQQPQGDSKTTNSDPQSKQGEESKKSSAPDDNQPLDPMYTKPSVENVDESNKQQEKENSSNIKKEKPDDSQEKGDEEQKKEQADVANKNQEEEVKETPSAAPVHQGEQIVENDDEGQYDEFQVVGAKKGASKSTATTTKKTTSVTTTTQKIQSSEPTDAKKKPTNQSSNQQKPPAKPAPAPVPSKPPMTNEEAAQMSRELTKEETKKMEDSLRPRRDSKGTIDPIRNVASYDNQVTDPMDALFQKKYEKTREEMEKNEQKKKDLKATKGEKNDIYLERFQAASKKNRQLEARIDQQDRQIQQLNQTRQQQIDQINRLQADLQRSQQETQDAKRSMQGAVANGNQEIYKRDQQIANLTKRCDAYEKQKQRIVQKALAIGTELTTLKKQLPYLKDQLKTCDDSRVVGQNVFQGKIKLYKQEYNKTKQECKRLSDVDVQNSRLNQQIMIMKQKCEADEAQITQLNKTYSDQGKQIVQQRNQIHELECNQDRFARIHTENEINLVSIAQKTEELKAQENQLIEAQKQFVKEKSDLYAQKQKEDQEREIRVKQEQETLNAQYSQQTDKIDAMQIQIDQKKKDLSEKKAEVEALKTKIREQKIEMKTQIENAVKEANREKTIVNQEQAAKAASDPSSILVQLFAAFIMVVIGYSVGQQTAQPIQV